MSRKSWAESNVANAEQAEKSARLSEMIKDNLIVFSTSLIGSWKPMIKVHGGVVSYRHEGFH